MARNTQEEARRTRERLLDAAIAVFSAHGVARPSLSELAVRIGMTRGAVYVHFRNKADVLIGLFERERFPWHAIGWSESEAAGRDALQALRAALVELLRYVSATPKRVRTLNLLFHKVELSRENARLVRRLRAAKEEGDQRIGQLLALAAKQRRVRPDLDLALATRFVATGINGAIWSWSFEPAAFDIAAEAECIVDALLLPLYSGDCLSRSRRTVNPGRSLYGKRRATK